MPHTHNLTGKFVKGIVQRRAVGEVVTMIIAFNGDGGR